MTNQRKLGALLSYVTIALQNVVGLVYTPFLIRMLGKSDYGLYSLVTSIISYLTLLDFGFADAVVRYTAKYRAEERTREQYSLFGLFSVVYGVIAFLALILGLVFVFHLDSFFADSMTAEEIHRAKIMLLCLVVNLALTFIFSVYKAILDAYEQFVFVRVLNILRIVLNTGIMVLLLNLGFKAVALVVLITILNVLILISNFCYCFAKLKIKVFFRNINWSKLKEMGSYSIFIFLNGCISQIYWFSGQFILGIYHGAKVIAVYAIAIQLSFMFKHFTGAINSVFFPKITALTTRTDSAPEISNIFLKIGRLQYLVISLILSGFILFGREFILLWAGDGYQEAFAITLIFFVALTPAQTQQIGWHVCKARNHLKFRTYTYFAIALLCLAGQIVGSKYYGMAGNAVSIAVALLLMEGLILNVYYQKKEQLDIVAFWKNFARLSIVPCVCVAGCLLVKTQVFFDSWFKLLSGIAAYSFVFFVLSYLFSLNEYEKGLLRPLTKRLGRLGFR